MASGVYYPIRHDRLTYTPMRNNLYCYKKWFMKTPQNTSTIVKIILNHSKWIYDLKLNKSTLSPGELVFWLANQWRFVLLVGETVLKFLYENQVILSQKTIYKNSQNTPVTWNLLSHRSWLIDQATLLWKPTYIFIKSDPRPPLPSLQCFAH
jgi:hypothetical protein